MLARQKSLINSAQDESDRLLEKGYPIKTFSKLLDATESLLKNAMSEVTEKFRAGTFPGKFLYRICHIFGAKDVKFLSHVGDVVAPIDNATIQTLTSKLKELKRLIGKSRNSTKDEKLFEIIQEDLDTAEKELRYLDIKWHSKSLM